MDCTDYLEYFENDPETQYIAMYLEGVRDGQKLLKLVRRISPKKPIAVLKGGLTSAGAKAAASHTGSLAGENVVWDAFFTQSGAIPVDSLEEMVDVLQALQRLPRCTGRGILLIGGAGGTGVHSADVCARAGLEVPTIEEEVQAELREFIGVAGTSVRNPMDVGMQLRGPEDFARVLNIAERDVNIDLVLMMMMVFPRRMGWRGSGIRAMRRAFLKSVKGRRKPFAVAMRSPSENLEAERDRLYTMQAFIKAGVPVFKTIDRACRALYKYTGYYRWLEERGEAADGGRETRKVGRKLRLAREPLLAVESAPREGKGEES
jgi:acyl-CoA synthetase (NDP forming)